MVTRRVSEGLAATGLATSSSLTRRVTLGQLVIKAGQEEMSIAVCTSVGLS